MIVVKINLTLLFIIIDNIVNELFNTGGYKKKKIQLKYNLNNV